MNRKAVIVVCISIVITLTTVMLSSFKSATQTYEGFAPTGGGTYRLQASIGTSDTSFTLSSFKEPVSNIKYTMSYLNSDIVYGTLDPQTSKPEFISYWHNSKRRWYCDSYRCHERFVTNTSW